MRWSHYSVSQKITRRLSDFFIFSQTVKNFSLIFYTPIIRSYVRWTANFYLVNSKFDEVMPY